MAARTATKCLSAHILDERRERGITRKAQAQEIGVNVGILARAEKGALPGPGNFVALSDHFGVKPSDLCLASLDEPNRRWVLGKGPKPARQRGVAA